MLENDCVGHRSGTNPLLAFVVSQNQSNVRRWTVSRKARSAVVGVNRLPPAGTDALLLCALINVIATDGLVDLGAAAQHVVGVDEALAAVAGCTPESVEGRTGVPAATVRRIAHELATAPAAAVYGRIGVHTVVGGTVASWATAVPRCGSGFISLPHQDRPAGVAAIQRVEQVADPGRPPGGVPLDLGQPMLSALVHVHQAANRDVLLLHG